MKRIFVSLGLAAALIGAGLGGFMGSEIGAFFGNKIGNNFVGKEGDNPDFFCEFINSTAKAQEGKMVDKATRLDEVYCQNRTTTYKYTLITSSIGDIDIVNFLEVMPARIKKSYCEQMNQMVKEGISANWSYHDKNGIHIIDIIFEPENCQ